MCCTMCLFDFFMVFFVSFKGLLLFGMFSKGSSVFFFVSQFFFCLLVQSYVLMIYDSFIGLSGLTRVFVGSLKGFLTDIMTFWD